MVYTQYPLIPLFICVLIQCAAAAVTQAITGGCQMAYMSPMYIHLEDVTIRIKQKYSLHLYRESGWDLDLSNGVQGIPVLFIPGNAGSYKQVRSIAASAARQFYESPARPKDHLWAAGVRNLDFFALDFNEDFSAFHGETLLEQAEFVNEAITYILQLYTHSKGRDLPNPTSVIILAHSMGGIVARHLFLSPGYIPHSINTIITLSTPHAYLPAPFDSGVEAVYTSINQFWKSYYHSASPDHPLHDVALISISGGTADVQISSDATLIDEFVRPENGLMLFTTSIPGLWSPVDHVAMMWCDQLRSRIASAMLEMVDARLARQTKSVEEVLRAFRKQVLNGEEVGIKGTQKKIVGDAVKLSMANSQNLIKVISSSSDILVQACQAEQSNCQTFDITGIQTLPASYTDKITSNQDQPIYYGELSGSVLDGSTHVEVGSSQANRFIRVSEEPQKILEYRISVLRLALRGLQDLLPAGQLQTVLNFPRLASSLLVYRFEYCSSCAAECKDKTSFAPLLQASTLSHHESHYFPNIQIASIHLHGNAPFIHTNSSALRLSLYRDPQCAPATPFKLSIDYSATFNTILIHYRSLLVAWPPAILMLVLAEQVKIYMQSGQMPSFFSSLRVFAHQDLPYWAFGSFVASMVQALILSNWPNATWARNMILGNDRATFAILAPLLLALAAIILFGVAGAVMLLLRCIQIISRLFGHAFPRIASLFTTPSDLSAIRRALPMFVLLIFVLFFAPYQFAFLVLALLVLLSTRPDQPYHFTILLIWLFIVPIRGPILIVWIRNLSVGWYQPFSSDHNIFNILGFLLWYEAAHSDKKGGNEFPVRHYSSRAGKILLLCMRFTAAWAIAFGVRFAYTIPNLVNLLLLSLAGLHWLAAH